MSVSGLPSIRTRSYSLSGSSVPIWSCFKVERAATCPRILLMSRGENTTLSVSSSSASDCFGCQFVSVP